MHYGHNRKHELDELIAESRRIQDALVRVVTKLDIFSEQLFDEIGKLQQATGASDARVPQDEPSMDSEADGATDPPGSPPGGRGGGGESRWRS